MGRKPVGDKPLSSAEKQWRYRERVRAKSEAMKAVPPADLDLASIRESIKKELRESWEPELKAERLAAERKEGRRLARLADRSSAQARVRGICDCAAFFIGKGRVDIAQALLEYFVVTRDVAVDALEADKRTKSMTLASLDKSGAFNKPPSVIR
jgi:hypothetical protein